MADYNHIIEHIRELHNTSEDFLPLHEPRFLGNERKYVLDCIDSTFVSSVGQYVVDFEEKIKAYTGAKYAIAVVNGTAALHLSLVLAGVKPNDLVVTQALSFVATANAIKYTNATPYFVDVDRATLGMSPKALKIFLDDVEVRDDVPYYIPTGQKVGAVVPMHTFGFPCEIDIIANLCADYNIPLIEDAAESLGSTYKEKHTGTFGLLGAYSFNGNKTITSGAGGIIVTNDDELGPLAKHLSTQAKKPHKWEYEHDMLGYNYRCPNLNAALACAQLENLEAFIANKRELAEEYKAFFQAENITFIEEPALSRSNYWLNGILLDSREERDAFLQATNDAGVMTRPVWTLLHRLEYLKDAMYDSLENSMYIEDRLVNIPSSVRV
ncbi:MAG: LegC family aminotransferase [Crocinitomicaceae bacterium]